MVVQLFSLPFETASRGVFVAVNFIEQYGIWATAAQRGIGEHAVEDFSVEHFTGWEMEHSSWSPPHVGSSQLWDANVGIIV